MIIVITYPMVYRFTYICATHVYMCVYVGCQFTRPICDLVVGRQVTAVDARHKLTRCLHDRHRQGQATSIDLDNRSFPLACLPLLAGTDRRRQTASKNDTNMRPAISVPRRVALTLHFLATDMYYY